MIWSRKSSTVRYFESLDREANIQRTLFIGNPSKLPGLTAYVEKSLNRPNTRVDSFNRLSGPQVTSEPLFRENTLSFFIAYGLALQGLGASKLKTNLLPREIIQQRLIRSKKPWFVALAAALLLGMAFNFFFNFRAWYSVHGDYRINNVSWTDAEKKVEALNQEAARFASRDQEKLDQLARLNEVGDTAVGSADGRMLWLELMKAITAALPNDVAEIPSLQAKPPEQRKEIYIQKIESKFFADLGQWFDSDVQGKYNQQNAIRKEMDANALEVSVPDLAGQSGWVIEIQGIHFQHQDQPSKGSEYIRHYLIDQLEFGDVELPVGDGSELKSFKLKELGILAPVEIDGVLDPDFKLTPPDAQPAAPKVRGERTPFGRPQPPAASANTIAAKAYRFTVQFCWTQITSEKRLEQHRLMESDPEQVSDQVAVEPGIRSGAMESGAKVFMRKLKRIHFWILCPLAVASGLGSWFLSVRSLKDETQKNSGKIKTLYSTLASVRGKDKHANDLVSAGMDALIEKHRQEVAAAWTERWNQQTNILTWPKELSEKFRRRWKDCDPSNALSISRSRQRKNWSARSEWSTKSTSRKNSSSLLIRLAASGAQAEDRGVTMGASPENASTNRPSAGRLESSQPERY